MWTVCRAANIKTLLMFQQVDVPQHYLGKFAQSATLWQFAEPYNTNCTQVHNKGSYHILFSCFNVSSAVCCNVLCRDGVMCCSVLQLRCVGVCYSVLLCITSSSRVLMSHLFSTNSMSSQKRHTARLSSAGVAVISKKTLGYSAKEPERRKDPATHIERASPVYKKIGVTWSSGVLMRHPHSNLYNCAFLRIVQQISSFLSSSHHHKYDEPEWSKSHEFYRSDLCRSRVLTAEAKDLFLQHASVLTAKATWNVINVSNDMSLFSPDRCSCFLKSRREIHIYCMCWVQRRFGNICWRERQMFWRERQTVFWRERHIYWRERDRSNVAVCGNILKTSMKECGHVYSRNELQADTQMWRRCSVFQCVAVCCSKFDDDAVYYSVLQGVAVCCSVLQQMWRQYGVLQCVAACCSVLQCVTANMTMTHVAQPLRRVAQSLRRRATCVAGIV